MFRTVGPKFLPMPLAVAWVNILTFSPPPSSSSPSPPPPPSSHFQQKTENTVGVVGPWQYMPSCFVSSKNKFFSRPFIDEF